MSKPPTPAMGAMRRMPTAFGPTSGPRQVSEPGLAWDNARSPLRHSAYARFAVPAASLQALVPAGCTVREPACLAIEFSELHEIDWLAGRGYTMLSVRIPVRYEGAGGPLDGWFQPVIWENLTEPILSGREELGWNKIYADLPPARQAPQGQVHEAQWQGFRFLRLTLSGLEPLEPVLPPATHVLHHKYIPATGDWGRADVDYLTVTPPGNSQASVLAHARAQATLELIRPTWQDMPTQHHIVGALCDLPIGALLGAGVYTTRGGKDLSDQQRLA